MWILTPLQAGGETHYLLPSKEYVVGRKNCDILLTNDQSISRAHAHLAATDQGLTLKDTSKYGTVVNGQRLAENTPVNLKSGDSVMFGVFESKFSVAYQKPVVCSSCLDSDGKASISQALLPFGGKLVNSWSQDCTHLVMPTAKVTIKTICALLCCRPIVKPEFFSELKTAAQQKLPPPRAESFVPDIDEPSLRAEDVNLGAILARKQLFTGKTFVFLSAKQLKRLNAAVSFGGGASRLLEEGSLPRDVLESPQNCVIDATTGNSQALLPSSATEWANSVKHIVQRKGLRVITESEIGLAAIYASCEQYCNPSSVIPDAESVQRVNPRIANASLSQSVAVDETVLPTTSQNITAYAANTEPSQGYQHSLPDAQTERGKVMGVTAVGETPEKKQNQNTSQLRGSKPEAQQTATECVVADTMSSSFNTVKNTESQKKTPESKLTVSGAGAGGIRSQPSFPKFSGGTRTFLQRESPQKLKNSPQASPQKQSTLTSFFQPVNKKRPLEDEFLTAMSEPKRPVLESSISMQALTTSVTSKGTSVPAGTFQTPLGSAADLFVGRSETNSDRVSHAVQEMPQSRKRKELEEAIQIDELESIMSEDMDCFDERPSYNRSQQAQSKIHGLTEKKQDFNAIASSSSKRQRVHQEENGTSKKPQFNLEKESGSHNNNSQKSEQRVISIKTEQVHPFENESAYHKSSKRPEVSSASRSENIEPFEDDDASFIEDLELLEGGVFQPKEEAKTPVKPAAIKQEVQETKISEDLPKKLQERKIDEELPKNRVLVEFRSLTVTAPPNTKPQRTQEISYAKNFKCFRKICVPGSKGSSHIIGGSDLLVHNRGKNTDLDEWLKDAAEEERQSRREETVGDDLFRYNPSKLTKRR